MPWRQFTSVSRGIILVWFKMPEQPKEAWHILRIAFLDELDADVEGECYRLDISNVFCVPYLVVNLLSVSHIYKKGIYVKFSRGSYVVKDDATGEVITTGCEKDGLY